MPPTTASSYFRPVAEGVYEPTMHVQGAWRPTEQHVSPLVGLLTHAMETYDARPGLQLCRISVDILGMIPLTTTAVRVETVRPGRTIELLQATATIDGRDVVADRAAVRRRLGVLSDARGLYPRLTGRENVEYYAALHGIAGTERTRRVDALVERLGLGEIADRRAQGYSQGERMKVAIARALVHDPDTILLDEPTNGLDIMSVRALREQLRGLRAAGRTLLFSSHVMQEVAALCDRIVILGHGRVVATGTADELIAQSGAATLEDAFVALLGSGEGLAA